MRRFVRSMLAVCAIGPALGCAAQTEEDTASTREALRAPVADDVPAISSPVISLQFTPCLSASDESAFIVTMNKAFAIYPGRVLAACNGSVEHVGLFGSPSGGADDLAARQRGLLAESSLLGPGETFAGRVAASYVSAESSANWSNMPRVLVAEGHGDPTGQGPIHLTSLLRAPSPPGQWITTLEGTDATLSPWPLPPPPAHFTQTTTDTLSAVNGRILCTYQSVLNGPPSLVQPLYVLFEEHGLGADFEGSTSSIVLSALDRPSWVHIGVCAYAAVFPSQVLVAHTNKKAVFSYQRAGTDDTGITVGGTMALVDRVPTAVITGATSIAVPQGTTRAVASYASVVTDFYSPQYAWRASGTMAASNNPDTWVTYPLTGTEHAGARMPESVHLEVVDADNPAAHAGMTRDVAIQIMPLDPPPPPKVCQVKPWLPQCQF